MIKFIIKRLLALIPVLVGVSLLVFFILDLAPGDPAKAALGEQARPEDIEAFREEMGASVRNHRGHQAEHAVRWHQHVHIPPGYLNARILDGPPADPVLLCKAGLVPGIGSRPGDQEPCAAVHRVRLHAHGIHRPYHQKLHA